MDWTRRTLLAAAASAALVPVGRSAAPGPPRNLVWLLGFGGWDTGVVVDPKPNLAGVDIPPGELVAYGALDVWLDDARPAVTGFFERWAAQTTLIRGIDVRSLAHVDCLRRLLTGTNLRSAPDVGAIVAATHGADRPLPYLLLGDRAFPGSLASYSGRMGLTNQLAALVDGSWPGAPAALATEDQDAVERYLRATSGLVEDRRGADLLEAYLASFDRADALRGVDLGESGVPTSVEVQLEIAVQALAGGLCRSVMIDGRVDLDDHVHIGQQLTSQDALFASLDALVGELAAAPGVEGGDTLLDETVVVVVSEMGRTPRMNAGGGKDHWPWTASLVLGGGTVGDRVLGATDDAVVGVTVDLATGAPDPVGAILGTDHFAAGLLSACGVDPGPWLPGIPALAI